MSESHQDDQRPTEDLPSEVHIEEPEDFIFSNGFQDLVFHNDPQRSLISHDALKSLISRVLNEGNSLLNEGVSCDDPDCDGSHTQSELDLNSYLASGGVTAWEHTRPMTRSMMVQVVSEDQLRSMLPTELADAWLGSHKSTEDPEGELEEDSKVAVNGEQVTAHESFTAATQANTREDVPSSQV